MPQYEIEIAGSAPRRFRARSAEDAAVRAGVSSPRLGTEADVEGWREVRSGDEPVGRVREFARMRFRRD
ncbi:MAG: hypothetical protein AAF791_01710 [Bacteroidota bacterium]